MNIGTVALRELAGGPGESADGPIEVSMRESDFQVIEVKNPNTGEPMAAPTTAKVVFTAQRFRELVIDGQPSGFWEFSVHVPTQTGTPASARVFVDGKDIFYVKTMSKLV